MTRRRKRDYIHVDDVNNLNILCMEHPAAVGEIFNAASGQVYSVNELYKIIAKILKSSTTPYYQEATKFWDKYPELFKGNHPLKKEILVNEVNKFSLGGIKKAFEKLGWKATISMQEGLTEIIKQEKEQKWKNQKKPY